MRPEPADVLLIDGRPGRFVWRGRLYTVLAVLERPPPAAEPDQQGPGPGDQRAGGRGQVHWRCWRVTAAPGKNVPAAEFRLCLDVAAQRWALTRNGD